MGIDFRPEKYRITTYYAATSVISIFFVQQAENLSRVDPTTCLASRGKRPRQVMLCKRALERPVNLSVTIIVFRSLTGCL